MSSNVTRSVENAEGIITETEVTEPRVTISFSRKMSPKQFESAEASIFIQVPIGLVEATPEGIESAAKPLYALAKSLVFDELGVDYGIDPTTNTVVEKLTQRVGAEVVAERPTAQRAAGNRPPTAKRVSADVEALWADWESDPTQWWDNREDKRNPRAPDFKHKKTGAGLWLNTKPAHVDVG